MSLRSMIALFISVSFAGAACMQVDCRYQELHAAFESRDAMAIARELRTIEKLCEKNEDSARCFWEKGLCWLNDKGQPFLVRKGALWVCAKSALNLKGETFAYYLGLATRLLKDEGDKVREQVLASFQLFTGDDFVVWHQIICELAQRYKGYGKGVRRQAVRILGKFPQVSPVQGRRAPSA